MSPVKLTYNGGGKKIRTCGYPRIKSVMGTRQVAKRVPADIINGYLTTCYFMDTDTDMMIPVPVNKLCKLLKYPCIYKSLDVNFGCFYLLFYFKNLHGLRKNHIYYGMMNLLGIM